VKEKYIHYEKAGDQYVGRVAAGLNVNSTEFAVSCPYFQFGVDGGGDHEDASVEEEIKNAIKILFLGGTRLNPQMYKILIQCYASICYHFEFLGEHLPERSRLRQSPLFQQCKATWIQIAVVKYPWDATDETPKLTGIPPHVALLAKLENLSRQMAKFKEEFRGVLVEELDSRHLGGDSYHAQKILSELETTRNQILNLISGGGTPNEEPQVSRPQIISPNRAQTQSGWHVYGGAFHMLPEGWRVPSMTFVQFISMWLTGDKENGVPPLYKVTIHHLKEHATQPRRVRSDFQYIMSHVARIGTSRNVWYGYNNHEWTTGQTLILYEHIYHKFCYPHKGKKRERFDEFSWRTVVNLVRNHKGQLVGEEDDDESSLPQLNDEV